MTTAAQLVAQIHEDLKETEEQLRHHPYLQALAEGRVSVEALRAFPGHQYQVVASDLRSFLRWAKRSSMLASPRAEGGNMQCVMASLATVCVARKIGQQS